MASYSVAISKHPTLAADTVDEVTLPFKNGNVEVYNHGADRIYFRWDGTPATVKGDDTRVVDGGGGLIVSCKSADPSKYVVLSLISGSETDYSVTVAR